MIGHALLVLGAALTLLAAIGMVRFRDAFSRMHALTKASTAGSLLVLLGAARTSDVTSLGCDMAIAAPRRTRRLPAVEALVSACMREKASRKRTMPIAASSVNAAPSTRSACPIIGPCPR